MQGKVEISGVNTAKLKTLSNEEMMHLIELAQAGDEQAKQKLVEGNLKLVLSVIQRFMGRGENPDDLFQVGCIGLLKAIANFDTSKQVRFSTYGVPMIAGELRRYLRDYSPIRVSRSVRDTAYRVLQCKQELVEKNGREPTMEEIARAMDVPLEEVVGAMDAIASPVSLYEPVYSDGGDPLTVMDQVRDTKNTDERWLDSIAIRQAISQLSAREKRILALRFYDGRTQMEVAGSIGISQAQVSRLEKNALSAIRKAISVSEGKDFPHTVGKSNDGRGAYGQPVFRTAQQGNHPRLRGYEAGLSQRSLHRHRHRQGYGNHGSGTLPVSGAVRQRLRLHHSLGLYPKNRRGYHPCRRTHSGLARAAQETRAVLRLAGRGKA